jgi:hypothetical protein
MIISLICRPEFNTLPSAVQDVYEVSDSCRVMQVSIEEMSKSVEREFYLK